MKVTLPDGSVKEFDSPVTAYDVAMTIGEGLAKAAIGARVNGVLTDVNRPIEEDCELGIVTAPRFDKKGKSKWRDEAHEKDALYLLRHSTAHVMAEAIERLWPDTELAYGPPLDNGFYYDIKLDTPISADDFVKIEEEMKKIVAENRAFQRYDLLIDEGMAKLKDENNKYKLDNAQRAVEGGSATLSWYVTGEKGQWEDLCMGPHLPNTSHIAAFKVMSIAQSHWHGDIESDAFQRVYGTAFFSQADLDDHMEKLEEARKRDHRVVGRKLGLFEINDTVGQGLILWKPNGAVVRQELQNFILQHLERQGYSQVFTPHIGKLDLYRTSGHYPYYSDSQFPPLVDRETIKKLGDEGCSCSELANHLENGEIEGYLLKPMNCPMHIKIFDSEKRSYRDLPIRLAEFGTVYRWEQSGELGGMTRVRGFTQDDAHLFVTPDQLAKEVLGCIELVKIVFKTLGMDDYRVRVGLRDPDSTKFVGNSDDWDQAEKACIDAAQSLGVPFSKEPGEAAFYGPKIDFVVKDVIGREWQLGTVQVDYQLPQRFKLEYIGADNAPHVPIMIHRAPFGSMERFVGVLIEHFNGAFPLWLAPEQVRVLPISDKFTDYAEKVLAALKAKGMRVTLDSSNERVNAKIKDAQEMKVPYMLVVGGRDADAGTVSVRERFEGDLGALSLEDFVNQAKAEIDSKGETRVTVSK
ncbi:MAG: threonine--tRNA ligase [Phycisphaeraceae bacterium]|nr:threonine--tRNA ligase [Phycisphaeraceae bacterium]